MNCWNCRQPATAAEDALCSRCGQWLSPSADQAEQTTAHIRFLLKESERWESVPSRWRQGLKERYQERLKFLEPLCESVAPPRPRPGLAPAQVIAVSAAKTEPQPPGIDEAEQAEDGRQLENALAAGQVSENKALQAPHNENHGTDRPRDEAESLEGRPGKNDAPPREKDWTHEAPPVKETVPARSGVHRPLANRPIDSGSAFGRPTPEQPPKRAPLYKLRPEDLLPDPEPEPAYAVAGESMDDLRQMLAERNVSGLMMVGALLLLAAYIGFLKAFWEDGIGKQLAALTMVISPAFFFGFAHWLRERLPQSSRMMSVVGGLLMPVGLLTVNHFHMLGLHMPSTLWSPLSFGISAAILLFQAYSLPEVACLYLAVLSAFLAGLTTGNNLIVALLAFGGAAAILYYSSQSFQDSEFKPHYERVSHLLAAGGLLSGVLRTQNSFESSATVFLVGAVYYAGSAYLGKSVKALLVSAVTGLAGFWACQNMLHLSSPMLGLCSLIQGSLYLSRAKKLMSSQDEDAKALGQASYYLGIGLTGAVLTATLGWSMVSGLWDSFAAYSSGEQLLCILTGALGFLYYAYAAYHYRNPALLYPSAASFVYGYLVLAVLTWHSQLELYRFLLIALPLAWQALALGLRSYIPREYLTPWVLSGTLLAALIGPLNLVAQVNHPSPFDLYIYLGIAAVFLAAALWQDQGAFLYPGLTSTVIAYTTWLTLQPHHVEHPNYGLLFLPLVAVLTGLTWGLDRGAQNRQYAIPVAQVSLALGLFFTLIQIEYLSESRFDYVTLPLALYGLGFAAAGWIFGRPTSLEWKLLGTRWSDFAFCWSSLCLLTAIGAVGDMQLVTVGVSLSLCAVGVMGGALLPSRLGSPLAASYFRSQIPAGLAWSLGPCFFGEPRLALASALVWIVPALLLPVAPPAEKPATSNPWLAAAWTATGLAFLGATRVHFEPLAGWGLALLGMLQLCISWKWSDPVANLCALISAVMGWTALLHGLSEDFLFPGFWLLQLIFTGFAFATRTMRPAVYAAAQSAAKLLALGILIVLPHDGWGCVTALIYGAAYSIAGVLASSTWEFATGSALVAWSLLLTSFYAPLSAPVSSLAWAGLGWLYLVLSMVLPPVRPFCLRFGPALTAPAWFYAGGFLTVSPSPLSLLVCAALWAARAFLVPDRDDLADEERSAYLSLSPLGPLNHHVAFFFAYSAWLQMMPPGCLAEAWTLPIGLWILFWTEALLGGSHPSALSWRRVGLAITLFPSILFSLDGGVHGIFALALGTVCLFLGTVLTQAAYMSLGPLALLIEIAIQALKVAVNFPWYVWALGAAVLIIGLALFTDYRRKHQVNSAPDNFTS